MVDTFVNRPTPIRHRGKVEVTLRFTVFLGYLSSYVGYVLHIWYVGYNVIWTFV